MVQHPEDIPRYLYVLVGSYSNFLWFHVIRLPAQYEADRFQCGFAPVVGLSILVYFPSEPPLPPSLSTFLKQQPRIDRPGFFEHIRGLLTMPYLFLALGLGLGFGAGSGLAAVLAATLFPLGLTQDEVICLASSSLLCSSCAGGMDGIL